jgi:hypothetical protein
MSYQMPMMTSSKNRLSAGVSSGRVMMLVIDACSFT